MTDSIIEIHCGERLTIANAIDLYTRLLIALSEEQAITIDTSRIERIDMAAIQLLYSFQQDASRYGIVVIWATPSQVFCDAVDILGFRAFYR